MRLATIIDDGRASVAVVRHGRVLPLYIPDAGLDTMREIAASGEAGLRRIGAWIERQPDATYRSLENIQIGPVVPDPGAIYTIGLNYHPVEGPDDGPDRPMVYGKAAPSVTGQAAVVAWDRSVTANVDAECELGVVIGTEARAVAPEAAMEHVFGYTCINDISSRDPWLDGDQWLLGKSLPGFCPVGPWLVTRDTIGHARGLRLGCTINGVAVQDGNTAQMRFSIPEVIAYLSRHVTLRPGDLIATGTPERLAGPIGPERHLQPGDAVTIWIERIGELTTIIA